MASNTPPATNVDSTAASSRGSSDKPAAAAAAGTNPPLAFFGSNAAAWTARQSQSGGNDDEHVWYQPIVISVSLGVFLLYFCVLREENDIDGKLDGSLFDHVSGMEETQLRVAHQYNRQHGLPTEALERRIAELSELADQKGAAAAV